MLTLRVPYSSALISVLCDQSINARAAALLTRRVAEMRTSDGRNQSKSIRVRVRADIGPFCFIPADIFSSHWLSLRCQYSHHNDCHRRSTTTAIIIHNDHNDECLTGSGPRTHSTTPHSHHSTYTLSLSSSSSVSRRPSSPRWNKSTWCGVHLDRVTFRLERECERCSQQCQ